MTFASSRTLPGHSYRCSRSRAFGLTVVTLEPAEREAWKSEARAAYPTLRERSSDPRQFDVVLRLTEEYRAARAGSAAAERPPHR